jgi:hypothetical protein
MKKHFIILFLNILLCISLFMTFPCKANVVWSDDFNDGDYRGWTIDGGTFSAEDNTLKTILGDSYYGIYISSFVATGTWSFDVLVGTETDIFFMYTPLMNEQDEYEGIEILWYGTHLQLYSYSSFYDAGSLRLGEYIFSSNIPGWQHLDVTRNSKGRICIYHNETLILDLIDQAPLTSSEFFIYLPNGEAAIDNVVVSNTVDIEPPPSIPFYLQTWFLATAGAVAAAIIVALLMLRKR